MKKILFAMAATALIAGCQKTPEAADKAADATATAPADTSTPAPATAAAGGTGVAECDAIFAKIEACFKDKIPEAQRGAMMQGFEQSKKQIAAMPDKTKIAEACKAQGEKMKASLAPMGCAL